MQSKEAIRAIKERLNIVAIVQRYVELKRNGPRWTAPCPFHQETKPSFTVNEEQGLFYCFGCQASGDIFDFYSRINGLDFRETLTQLAEQAGIFLESGPHSPQRGEQKNRQHSQRQLALRMHELAASHFAAALRSPEGEECQAYMRSRGLSEEIIQNFGLGWARRDWQSLTKALQRGGFSPQAGAEAGLLGKSENGRWYDRFRGRLIFPIKNLSNQIIAFGGRIIAGEDEAKYINSADSPIYKKGEHLYGLAQARRGIVTKGHALLTEGYMDVLTLHQFDYTNAVGVLGTALTPEQVKRLAGFTSRMTLLFDGDRAGRKAALRACEMLLTRGLSCRVVLMPEGEDIDSLLRGAGREAFEALQAQAPEGLRFCVDVLKALAPRETVEWARNFLRQVEIPELVSPYTSQLAGHLQISEAELRATLANRKMQAGAPSAPDTPPHGILEREIMMYAVRYPHRLADMQVMGADVVLRSPVARKLWDKLEHHSPEEAFHLLDEREKAFWCKCRSPEAPPRDAGDRELKALHDFMDGYYAAAQTSSLSAALRANTGAGNFEDDVRYLHALMKNLGERA
ncbi:MULTISPECIES: DNA primase [unclassified Desulfovibrio]|uniref:DNA primase n=1 Tax=unclassified Desulfovibrio TaxID=2593640 RepID=UPI000F5E1956|nr:MULTISPECIES: DNA primase [unclassified Desulfovibrio]RRD71040.1 DNA primase [Desulfovibrio sp. OH1209_COT-279]RRD87382.1 DNA primase [Desulfovibrio sp. OH1186_COT-070]